MQWLKKLFGGKDAAKAPVLPQEWVMPVAGETIALADVNDEAFARGMMGAGFAIRATDSTIKSPVNGRVEAVFPGGHAMGILADDGTEILLHIGIDSVKQKGAGFRVLIEEGAAVRAGDPLLEVDFAALAHLPDTAVLILFTSITEGEVVIREGRPVWQA
ncbi:MAG: PTS glucose transporter subunit IIA [Cardiobacteriaceae bacterium]|nr:PTS glucose transporter subunit IIA [Cardiobacteriaceae bacterium]